MNLIEQFCEGQPEDIQMKIKGAYWTGLNEGMAYANSTESKIDHKEDNIVFLKDPTDP